MLVSQGTFCPVSSLTRCALAIWSQIGHCREPRRTASVDGHAHVAPANYSWPITQESSCVRSPFSPLATIVHAQSTGPSTGQTSQTDAKTIWEKFKGSWNQTKGAVKEQWGKLTDDDLLEIEGRRDQLVGKIQARYGITREEAESQVGTWEQKRYRDM
jgi:uncharacterized protein YjbJ (UPF0337 family)